MAHCYRLWRRERLGPADALRKAEVWLRDAPKGKLHDEHPVGLRLAGHDLPTQHRWFWDEARMHGRPYNWAAFTFVGDSRRLTLPSAPRPEGGRHGN